MIVSQKDKKYYYYINIASPFLLEEEIIKYIDFDLDYRIPNAKSTKINLLDQNEFEEHAIKYQYPAKLVTKIKKVQQEILDKFQRKEFDQYLNYDLIHRGQDENE
jgi:protein associated with RNAse G/E